MNDLKEGSNVIRMNLYNNLILNEGFVVNSCFIHSNEEKKEENEIIISEKNRERKEEHNFQNSKMDVIK